MPIGIYFNRSSMSMADRELLAEAIKTMRDDGTVRAIYARHLGAPAVEAIVKGAASLLADRRKR